MYCIQPEGTSSLFGHDGFITQTAVELWFRRNGWAKRAPVEWHIPGRIVAKIIRTMECVPLRDVDELPKGECSQQEDDLIENFYRNNMQSL